MRGIESQTLRYREARTPPGVATIFNILHFVITNEVATSSGTLSHRES